jgi:hypothetical protein
MLLEDLLNRDVFLVKLAVEARDPLLDQELIVGFLLLKHLGARDHLGFEVISMDRVVLASEGDVSEEFLDLISGEASSQLLESNSQLFLSQSMGP